MIPLDNQHKSGLRVIILSLQRRRHNIIEVIDKFSISLQAIREDQPNLASEALYARRVSRSLCGNPLRKNILDLAHLVSTSKVLTRKCRRQLREGQLLAAVDVVFNHPHQREDLEVLQHDSNR